MESQVETAIYNALLASSAITDITSDVYPEMAPESAGNTVIVISLNAGSWNNDNPAQQANDLNYLVKAISNVPSTASALAEAIYNTLHETQLSLSSWTNYRTQAITPVRQVEQVDREQYWHRGYIFRIRNNA